MLPKMRPLGIIVLASLTLLSCSSGGSDDSNSSSETPPLAGTTVQVSVTATDPDDDQLHYRWATTDGTINNVDAPNTTWVVPTGRGLQFAYVVVSDGKGGYIESRAAALTSDPPIVTSTSAPALTPPAPTGAPGFVWGSVYSASFGRNVYLPGVTVTLANNQSAVTDMKGQFFIPNVPDNDAGYAVEYTMPGQNTKITFGSNAPVGAANNSLPTSPSSPAFFQGQVNPPGMIQIAGSVRMKDLSYCGIRNEFFTHSSAPNLFREPLSGTALLLDTNNNPLSSPVPVNHYGDFLIVRGEGEPIANTKVRVTCEEAVVDSEPFDLPGSGTITLSKTVSLPNSRPTITKMTVQVNGEEKGRPDLPRPRTLFTSRSGAQARFGDNDLIAEIIHTPGDDAFFTYKGIDTRKSACAYYRAIGAVQGCDADGRPTGAQLTLAQWRSKFNLSPFPNGKPSNPPTPDGQEVRLQYINRNDLNLGRDMQAIRLTDGAIAYNTCNYPGPLDVLDPLGVATPKEIGLETQADINRSIQNIRDDLSLIACVAMDTSVIPGINGDQPFLKFYTFGPTGQLLLSVSLDGRREKFMPGSCTICHGGDASGGHFPSDGSGRPNLGSRFQPFDIANLEFSSSQKQNMGAVEEAIKKLNQMMVPEADGGLPPVPGSTIDLTSFTTDRTRELVSNWYRNGRATQDTTFVPARYSGQENFYRNAVRPMCQTCHAAQKMPELNRQIEVCGKSDTDGRNLELSHSMPGALVPFERFWLDSTSRELLGCGGRPAKHPEL